MQLDFPMLVNKAEHRLWNGVKKRSIEGGNRIYASQYTEGEAQFAPGRGIAKEDTGVSATPLMLEAQFIYAKGSVSKEDLYEIEGYGKVIPTILHESIIDKIENTIVNGGSDSFNTVPATAENVAEGLAYLKGSNFLLYVRPDYYAAHATEINPFIDRVVFKNDMSNEVVGIDLDNYVLYASSFNQHEFEEIDENTSKFRVEGLFAGAPVSDIAMFVIGEPATTTTTSSTTTTTTEAPTTTTTTTAAPKK